MKTIYETAQIGNLPLKNWIIRSATMEGSCEQDGKFADKLIPIYENLARGGVSAIITGMMGIDTNSRVSPTMVMAYTDTFVEELKKVSQSVHTFDCKLIVQLSHCGQKAVPDDGSSPFGPSQNKSDTNTQFQAMTQKDIDQVIAAYALAAARCKEAAADAIQIHCAHGYLLSEFLSPYFNKRTDKYGGSIENRARIVFEVYAAIRKAVGKDFPVWIKINCTDLAQPSITFEECTWVCSELAKLGLNAVEISGGIAVDAKSSSAQVVRNEQEEAVFAKQALTLSEILPLSVISVCGYRSLGIIEQWLNKGDTAAVSLCRPLISEPELVERWRLGDKTKARCISCNKCFRPKSGFGCQQF